MSKSHYIFFGTLLIAVFLTSCKKDQAWPIGETFLHISHTRTTANPNLNTDVEALDLSQFSMVLLGGDMAYETSADDATMAHVNNIFDVGNPNTLWALGNHDYSNTNLIQSYTKRPTHYAYHRNGITFLVLDTQDSLSHITAAQLALFNQVTDTLQASSHLIVLHHKLFWMPGNDVLEQLIETTVNGELGACAYCTNPNNFYAAIYPKLVEAQTSGTQVICIGGDIGNKVSSFEHQTADNIYFLASGISYESENNEALVFFHDVPNKSLRWQFEPLKKLSQSD